MSEDSGKEQNRQDTSARDFREIGPNIPGTEIPMWIRGEINDKISAIMGEIKAVGKEGKNQQQGFSFRQVEDVYVHLKPLLAKHKVFTTHIILHRGAKQISSRGGSQGTHQLNQYWFFFWGKDGSYRATNIDGEGIDYGDKVQNKCLSIAHKYALVTTFAIPVKMEDPDNESHDITKSGNPGNPHNLPKPNQVKSNAAADQKKIIKEKATLAKSLFSQLGFKQADKDGKAKWMKDHCKIKKVDAMTAKDWDKVLNTLDKAVKDKYIKAGEKK